MRRPLETCSGFVASIAPFNKRIQRTGEGERFCRGRRPPQLIRKDVDMNEAVKPRSRMIHHGTARPGPGKVDGWHTDIRGLATALNCLRLGAASN